jgi:Serine acetyltransferase, N-terminal
MAAGEDLLALWKPTMEEPVSQTLLKQRNDDPIWDAVRQAAKALARQEPVLGKLADVGILKRACFEDALSYILAQLLGNEDAPVALLRKLFDGLLMMPGLERRRGLTSRRYANAIRPAIPR